jgi:hypothetical protein
MIKRYCDICGKEAVRDILTEAALNVGEPYQAVKGPDSAERTYQAQITINAGYGFKDWKTPTHEPPDLCHKCVSDLLKLLSDKAKEKAV